MGEENTGALKESRASPTQFQGPTDTSSAERKESFALSLGSFRWMSSAPRRQPAGNESLYRARASICTAPARMAINNQTL